MSDFPTGDVLHPHDLVCVDGSSLVGIDGTPRPDWVGAVLGSGQAVPGSRQAVLGSGDDLLSSDVWAVVRRAPIDDGMVPVGLRGATRSERWAAVVPTAAIRRRVTPAQAVLAIAPSRTELAPFRAVAALIPLLNEHCAGQWGIGGSVGFELVTGRPTARDDSDVDLLIDAPVPLERRDAARLAELARGASTPTHIDIQVTTPIGAFALDEWLRADGRHPIALKTLSGPRLTADPWTTHDSRSTP